MVRVLNAALGFVWAVLTLLTPSEIESASFVLDDLRPALIRALHGHDNDHADNPSALQVIYSCISTAKGHSPAQTAKCHFCTKVLIHCYLTNCYDL